MTHVIIAVDGNTCIHKEYPKSIEELCREIQLGSFESPVVMKNPTSVRLQNYLLVAEREENALLNPMQRNIMEMMANGITEVEMEARLFLTKSGIRYHIDALKQKFNVKTKEQLVAAYCRYLNRQ